MQTTPKYFFALKNLFKKNEIGENNSTEIGSHKSVILTYGHHM